jgi:hypothetical protein
MAFKYSCFISYRHGQNQLAERIVNDLSTALANELELYIGTEVYVDRERLKGGDFYNEELARALCQSICMIMVFTPRYFDLHSTYCAREFKAMEKLEEERLRVLERLTGKRVGLIIPIVFRGADSLSSEIKAHRHYYDFGDFLLCDTEISKHPNYARKIKQLAKTIFDIYQIFSLLSEDPCSGCEDFVLPAESEVTQWLRAICTPVLPLPSRRILPFG